MAVMKRQQREVIEKMSLMLWGKKSKWQKLYDRGALNISDGTAAVKNPATYIRIPTTKNKSMIMRKENAKALGLKVDHIVENDGQVYKTRKPDAVELIELLNRLMQLKYKEMVDSSNNRMAPYVFNFIDYNFAPPWNGFKLKGSLEDPGLKEVLQGLPEDLQKVFESHVTDDETEDIFCAIEFCHEAQNMLADYANSKVAHHAILAALDAELLAKAV